MSIRVLIADSDCLLLQSYREHLSGIGFEVTTAKNGLECVTCLRGLHPDVLVIDVDIPWGGGVGVLDMMRNGRELPCVPAIVLTARQDFADFEERLLFDSSCECQIKPLKPEQLVTIIRRLFDDQPGSFSSWKSSLLKVRRRSPRQRAATPSKGTASKLWVWKDEELQACEPRKS